MGAHVAPAPLPFSVHSVSAIFVRLAVVLVLTNTFFGFPGFTVRVSVLPDVF